MFQRRPSGSSPPPGVPLETLVNVLRNELQRVVENLAKPSVRAVTVQTPAAGLVRPDHIRVTLPVGMGLGKVQQQMDAAVVNGTAAPVSDNPQAISYRLYAMPYHEGQLPPPGLQLGSIEIQFVVAEK